MRWKKSGKPQTRIQSVKRLVESGQLTDRQSRFVKAFLATRSKTLAAIQAGYPKKNAAQSGYQAFKAVTEKAPEVIARMGITLENVIENHLLPKLDAKETKFAQHEGKFTDAVQVDALGIQLQAVQQMFELMGAYPPQDPALAARVGIKVVLIDIPRPPRAPINVTPTNGNRPQIPNEKPDPRPKN